MLCKPKICNYAVVIVVFSQENVLGFKVSVHHSVAVHNFQTLQNTLHDHFNLRGCELVSHLYLVVKLSALQQLHWDVDWILTFIDSVQFHKVFVVELAHDFDLVNKWFLAFFLAVGALLRKSLHCLLAAILMLDHQVNSCKISFSDLLNRFEQFVKATLVQLRLEVIPPTQQLFSWTNSLQNKPAVESLELKSNWCGVDFNYLRTILSRPQQLENKVKVEVYPKQGVFCQFLNDGNGTFTLRMMHSANSSALTSS